MNVRFLTVCLAEIEEALTRYEDQSPELPERILSEIADAVEKLSPFPEAFHLLSPPYRRVLLSKFPYILFFRVDPDEVVVVAFFHQHSDPKKWRSLLRNR
ncbi:type II toxin-antitoxin system RelE/ParE family toxin [Luteolibacter flavescens]|uniref:Type II toxin-antitoxin system RelE/ParE family toxin n=1 Tax=Luteolibacter flavescens TaxID=1859460 RepID=A0ABT3FSG7_9BACT|nr:type II toxin-antitoxin system RelE/ParE family toxin [Luteolibacter flavescens]MCW1885925.1 type II toxin-antitoxin system RelE/ParE family toxin [Luteolibacter flavescens]